MRIWDVRQTRQPVQTFNVTEYLDKKLCEVYESECIFDRFDLHVSPDSRMVLTGSYHSHTHVIDLQRRINTTIDVRFMDKRGKNTGTPRFYKNKRLIGSVNLPPLENNAKLMQKIPKQPSKEGGPPDQEEDEPRTSNCAPSKDPRDRITMGTWHPKEYTFAVAKHNSLFIYSEKRSQTPSSGSVKPDTVGQS